MEALEITLNKLNEIIEQQSKRIAELEAELEAEIVSLKKDLIKYGTHRCCFTEECTCGWDEIKERALDVIVDKSKP